MIADLEHMSLDEDEWIERKTLLFLYSDSIAPLMMALLIGIETYVVQSNVAGAHVTFLGAAAMLVCVFRSAKILAFQFFAKEQDYDVWRQAYFVSTLLFTMLMTSVGFVGMSSENTFVHTVVIANAVAFAGVMPMRMSVAPRFCACVIAIALSPIALAASRHQSDAETSLAVLLVIYILGAIKMMSFNYSMMRGSFRKSFRLGNMAAHDPLTGLANRAQLETRLERLLRERQRGEQVAVIYADLDHFKAANDRYGHAAGDEVLRRAGARIRRMMRPTDLAARVGGDEFVLVLNHVTSMRDVEQFANRLVATLSAPMRIDGLIINVGATAGVAVTDAADISAEVLRGKADDALYRAKRRARGTVAVSGATPSLAEFEVEFSDEAPEDADLDAANETHSCKTGTGPV